MEDICQVCFNDLGNDHTEGGILGCVHSKNYHDACLDKWFQINPTCPTCRCTCDQVKADLLHLQISCRSCKLPSKQCMIRLSLTDSKDILEEFVQPFIDCLQTITDMNHWVLFVLLQFASKGCTQGIGSTLKKHTGHLLNDVNLTMMSLCLLKSHISCCHNDGWMLAWYATRKYPNNAMVCEEALHIFSFIIQHDPRFVVTLVFLHDFREFLDMMFEHSSTAVYLMELIEHYPDKSLMSHVIRVAKGNHFKQIIKFLKMAPFDYSITFQSDVHARMDHHLYDADIQYAGLMFLDHFHTSNDQDVIYTVLRTLLEHGSKEEIVVFACRILRHLTMNNYQEVFNVLENIESKNNYHFWKLMSKVVRDISDEAKKKCYTMIVRTLCTCNDKGIVSAVMETSRNMYLI